MKIKTVTTFKNFDMDFTLGQEFTEDLGPVDGRKCQVCVFVCFIYFFLVNPFVMYLWETNGPLLKVTSARQRSVGKCGMCGADG